MLSFLNRKHLLLAAETRKNKAAKERKTKQSTYNKKTNSFGKDKKRQNTDIWIWGK